MITDDVLMNSMAMASATREAELLRIIEQKDTEICKLRHALNKLEQKYGRLKKQKGGERNALGNR